MTDRQIAKPTAAELERAAAVARGLPRAATVHVTDYAVWVDGAERWVCPKCLKVWGNRELRAHHYCPNPTCGHPVAP